MIIKGTSAYGSSTLQKIEGFSQHKRPVLLTVAASLLLFLTFTAGVLAHRQGLIGATRTWIAEHVHPNYLSALAFGPSLPTLIIDMGFQEFQKVSAKRAEALNRGILLSSDDDFVPADIRFEGRTIPVDMRLKGDWLDHLQTEKWSYRIEVDNDDYIFGMRRFSIQHPMTRSYVHEWGYLESMRREGILAPRYQFATVIFNGEKKGIYAVEEFFYKEMLESQRRREGILLAFDESLLWQRRSQGVGGAATAGEDYFNNLYLWPLETYGSGRIEKSPELREQRDTAWGLLQSFREGTLAPSEVFDVPLLARFLALNELWGALHGLMQNNLVFYYNPVTGKLEPVASEGEPQLTSLALILGRLIAAHTPVTDVEWLQSILRDPEIAEAYVQELERVTSPAYSETLREAIGEDFRRYSLALHREWPTLPTDPWGLLEARQKSIKAILDPPELVQALHTTSMGEDLSEPGLRIANLFPLPVEVVALAVGEGKSVSAAEALREETAAISHVTSSGTVVLQPYTQNGTKGLQYVDFSLARLEAISNAAQDLKVLVRILGKSAIQETAVIRVSTLTHPVGPPSLSIEEVLAKHPFLQETDAPQVLAVRPGEWMVDGSLVLPKGIGLSVSPGTILRFGQDDFLAAWGPLIFSGTEDQPIILTSSGDSWPGLVVFEAQRPSVWRHVEIANTRGIRERGWTLTGGITFYRSPVSLNSVRILRSEAEDAINIIETTFGFTQVEIGDSVSDALDGDFVEGTILNSSFHDIGGDALDFSGSRITVQNVIVRNVADKGISAGEATTVHATGFDADGVGIGVASKDSSSVDISDSIIHSFTHFGMAAYIKKPVYGSAHIVAWNVTLPDSEDTLLVQEQSWIRRDGKDFSSTKEVNVAKLYAAGVLGN